MAEGQEFRVARDEDIRLGGNSSGEDPEIVFVSEFDLRRLSGPGQCAVLSHELDELGRQGPGQSKLGPENPPQLIDHLFRYDRLVVRKDLSHHVSAQPARRGCTGQNVRVQEHLHETSVNTSSSAR